MGRGWDQNDWEEKEFPKKTLLDKLFPNTPIALTRVDGHAILCNQAALDLGKVTSESKIEGGEVVLENGELTGVLVDNAESLVWDYWPQSTRDDAIKALLAAQDICFDLGLTTVDDAGLGQQEIELIDSLQQSGDLKNVSHEILLFSILSTLRNLYLWIPKKDDLKKEQLIEDLSEILLQGVVS